MGREVSGEHHAEELGGHLGVVEGAVGAVGLEGDATPVGSLLELDGAAGVNSRSRTILLA